VTPYLLSPLVGDKGYGMNNQNGRGDEEDPIKRTKVPNRIKKICLELKYIKTSKMRGK